MYKVSHLTRDTDKSLSPLEIVNRDVTELHSPPLPSAVLFTPLLILALPFNGRLAGGGGGAGAGHLQTASWSYGS